jgi:hypothetical protein
MACAQQSASGRRRAPGAAGGESSLNINRAHRMVCHRTNIYALTRLGEGRARTAVGWGKGPETKNRIALLTALFTLAFPAMAGATLVINGGMFGVSLGNTLKQARQKLGRPNEVDHSGATTTWFYSERGLYIDFSRNNRVHDLETDGFSQRTASGVGVGSSETALMRLMPGVHCSPNFQGSQGSECIAASAHVVTDFHITGRRGLVQSVLISQKP